MPSLATAPAPPEASPTALLRPSDPADDAQSTHSERRVFQLRAHALLRGTLVHRLLQSLPDVAPDRRREAALKYLARNAAGWTEAIAKRWPQVARPDRGSRFAAVFAAGSRAEVSIAGRLERPGRPPALVSGQIDRLVVTPSEVLIVDYKTNYAPPRAVGRGAAGLCPPARALSRGAGEALSPTADPRRAAVDRNS